MATKKWKDIKHKKDNKAIKEVSVTVDKTGDFKVKCETQQLQMLNINDWASDSARIYCVVLEKAYNGTIQLECGRAAAQAAHAVSDLKLSYTKLQMQKGASPDQIIDIVRTPITTIVLKARDEKELYHILHIASERNLHRVDFYDDNPTLYKTPLPVFTAVAIGPVESWWMDGITDYLPLWKCGCEPVLK